jgi:hypothetical protein
LKIVVITGCKPNCKYLCYCIEHGLDTLRFVFSVWRITIELFTIEKLAIKIVLKIASKNTLKLTRDRQTDRQTDRQRNRLKLTENEQRRP